MAKGTRRRSFHTLMDGRSGNPAPIALATSPVLKSEAIARAKEILRKTGGGELTIHRRDGTIRELDTVSPASDPRPPKDTTTSAA